MKRQNVWLLIVLCIMIGFSFGYIFRDSSKKDIEVIEHSLDYEVYEEFEANKLLEIYVDSVNVHLRVLPSNNRNIRLVYRPSVEPSNFTYYMENKIMHLQVSEVETSSSIVPNHREMIYLYLPTHTDVSLHYTSDSGFLDVTNVSLRNLYVNTKSGIVSLGNTNVVLDVDVKTVSGKVIVKDLEFTNLDVETNTALISCNLPYDETMYALDCVSKEGKVLVNDDLYMKNVNQDALYNVQLHSRSGGIRVNLKENIEYEE